MKVALKYKAVLVEMMVLIVHISLYLRDKKFFCIMQSRRPVSYLVDT